MWFSAQITLGDAVMVATLFASIAYNYIAVVRRVDRIGYRQDATEKAVEDMRRGRGLILEHWPPMVRRCFGYGANGTAD